MTISLERVVQPTLCLILLPVSAYAMHVVSNEWTTSPTGLLALVCVTWLWNQEESTISPCTGLIFTHFCKHDKFGAAVVKWTADLVYLCSVIYSWSD